MFRRRRRTGSGACFDRRRYDERFMRTLTDACQALSDPTRLRLLVALAREAKNVSTLCEELALKQPSASHHPGLLKMTGFVGAKRTGKEVFYGLDGVTASHSRGSTSFEIQCEDGVMRVTTSRRPGPASRRP